MDRRDLTADRHVADSTASSRAVLRRRHMITVTVMVASILQAIDNTIANVALPRMQGTLSATQDQMVWVLTSYIVAASIMIPLAGWLADRFGRKPLFLVSIVGFTLSSALCGMAQSLEQIVVFRILQGLCGAALIPMSQAVLLDIYPKDQQGRAMSIWGIGVILGPTLGPLLGGWLTDNYSWRWVFYINVPFGIVAVLGVLAYFPDTTHGRRHIDLFGFSLLSVFIGALQLLLDRGPVKGWFEAGEVKLEAAIAAFALYQFLAHSITTEQPFIRFGLFKDRNFLNGCIFSFVISTTMFSTMALLPPLLQELMHYSVLQAGVVMAPRGVGMFIAMFAVGRLVGKVDGRLMMASGLIVAALALWLMSHLSMQLDMNSVIWSGALQGLGLGIVYVPMSTLAFATLPTVWRNEGAAMFNLTRNVGTSVGISMVQGLLARNAQVLHATLAQHVTSWSLPNRPFGAYFGAHSLAALAAVDREVIAQATMIAYLDDFHLMMILTFAAMPLLCFMKSANPLGVVPKELSLE